MGRFGDDVHVLHDVLIFLGYTIPKEEYNKKIFGQETKDAIIKIQQKYGVPLPTGSVVKENVKYINMALDTRKPSVEFVIFGVVKYRNGPVAQGLIIRAYDVNQSIEKKLGNDVIIGDNGRYQIEYNSGELIKPDQKSPNLLVRAFRQEKEVAREARPNARATETVDLTIPEDAPTPPPEPTPEPHVVSGRVTYPDDRPFAKGLVRAFHEGSTVAIRLGEDTTDNDGRYTIRYDKLPGVTSINLRVVVLDADGGTLRQSDIIPEAGPLEIVNLVLPVQAVSEYHVEGHVFSLTSAGVAGLQVKIVDKSVGGDVLLVETVTDSEGGYQATFTDEDIISRGKTKPDLQARVFMGAEFIGSSEVRYDASKSETLDVLLNDAASPALGSEYEALISSISTHFKGRLEDLKETDEIQDITYLANKSGWDARAVAIASLADQFSANTGSGDEPVIHPALFYALFRAGLPANRDFLYQADPEIVSGIWKQSIDQGVIPTFLEDRIPDAAERFTVLAAQRALDGPAMIGLSSLKDVMLISFRDDIDEADQRQFAELYTRYGRDPDTFWEAVGSAFGDTVVARLKVDGQIAYLTLNNAPLMRKLHEAAEEEDTTITDPIDLVKINGGYYHAAVWKSTIGNDPIPPDVPGENDEERRNRYAELLAAQIRLSYPTAVVANMISTDETPVAEGLKGDVTDFLTSHQGSFEIGVQPIEQYLAKNNIQIDPAVSGEITRIQRVYQTTPGDETMNALLNKGLDSAYAITRYDQGDFVRLLKDDLGGEDKAALVYARSQQVQNAVMNIATSYLTSSRAPTMGLDSSGPIIDPKPKGPGPDSGDVIAYPTLEGLLGEMDFCTCEHCRSILSPAAYLVELLVFCDNPSSQTDKNPQKVLLDRRPDIQHIPLTCENTNTPLPYIDLVNEILEYYVTNSLSLNNYEGHTTEGSITPEELMANPQFVIKTAYDILAGKRFQTGDPLPTIPPVPPLPFYQSLESLRRHFDRFESPLPDVMEALRKDESVERASEDEYGWRDILMEEIRLSRLENQLLTDRNLTLQQIYGYPPSADVISDISNAKRFVRRMRITYEDLIEILKTRFINPDSTLIPKLERLGVSISTLKAFKEGTITDEEFMKALSPHIDESQYGGDIKAWVKNEDNYPRIMGLMLLTNTKTPEDICSFDDLEFRYADPLKSASNVKALEFVRLNRFIRLWRKLGWTIEQTDKVITSLYPGDELPNNQDDDENLQRLDRGFKVLLLRLGVLLRVMKALNLKPKKDLLPLLSCFAPIDTHGDSSLYRQMFLGPALRDKDQAFADDGFSNFLTDETKMIMDHTETLRSAFLLTDDELKQIARDLGYDASTHLTLDGISAIYRRGWLARSLKLSVLELLLLIHYTGFNPFAPPDPPYPPIMQLIGLIEDLRLASLKPTQALYLIWNQDISGRSVPDEGEISELARALRRDLASIESEFDLVDDPDGSIAQDKMTLVYGNEATDLFFGLLSKSIATEIPYVHDQDTLSQSILDASSGNLAYNSIRKRLSFAPGAMPESTHQALKIVAGVTAAFKDAVDELYAKTRQFFGPLGNSVVTEISYVQDEDTLSQSILDAALGSIAYDSLRKRLSFTAGVMPDKIHVALKAVAGENTPMGKAVEELYAKTQQQQFFDRYPELLPLYEAFATSSDTVEKRRSNLLAGLLPGLNALRKHQQALQAISAATETEMDFADVLLDSKEGDKFVLHSAADVALPALDDFTALETPGLTVQFFISDVVSDDENRKEPRVIAEDDLDYATPGKHQLPKNNKPHEEFISGIWSGLLEAPENGLYNIIIESNSGAQVTLILDGVTIDGPKPSNGRWTNATPMELRAGALYSISIKIESLKDRLKILWETPGRIKEVIPGRYLYSEDLFASMRRVYIRYLKAASLSTTLNLTPGEIAYLTTLQDYTISGQGWLNSLASEGEPAKSTFADLLEALREVLSFTRLKSELSPGDERLLSLIRDPGAKTENGNSLLLILTRFDPDSLDALLVWFGKVTTGDGKAERGFLRELKTFVRVYDAYAWVEKLGIDAKALIKAATNDPDRSTVRDLQSALRARYDEIDWLNILKPINDRMRGLQRDALVGYILHHMRYHPDPRLRDIDTPEKLFEYFLMDVQMEPCMQTSRIRHALSSVQIFIERCLMNLEGNVESASFDPRQWEWMKRYRVWEANRKVFLYPENWLEPELRDDQSPFFKEAMSELLQSDITEDAAATALLNYLSKLDEVAKLEPCGIYYAENDLRKVEDDIAHVVARTSGASRKYYYRRRESGYWTPWEQINLNIEDDPVIPVVWHGRLLLFWLQIRKQSPMVAQDVPTEPLIEISPSQIVSGEPPRLSVKAMLCWSEYYNGKWQPTKTSDVNHPAELGSYFSPDGIVTFDRSKLILRSIDEGDHLRISIKGSGHSEFLLYNTHSLPVKMDESVDWVLLPQIQPKERSMQLVDGTFSISYLPAYDPQIVPHPLLRNVLGYNINIPPRIIEPTHHLNNIWDAPFFYEDNRHVFYVTTSEKLVSINNWVSYIPRMTFDEPESMAPMVQIVPEIDTHANPLIDPGGPIMNGPVFGVIDTSPVKSFVTEDAYIGHAIGSSGTVQFGDKEIGPAGSIANDMLVQRGGKDHGK